MTRLPLVVCLLAVVSVGASRPILTTLNVSLAAKDWDIQYSAKMPKHPSTAAGGGWYFSFPLAPGHVNYVTTPYETPIPEGGWLIFTATVAVTGTPTFLADNEPYGHAATLRPYIEKKGDFNQRWWSNPVTFVIAPGTFQVSVPFTPDQWSGLDGMFATSDASHLTAWTDTLAHVGRVGLTCGGSFFGHGCHIDQGTARFTLWRAPASSKSLTTPR